MSIEVGPRAAPAELLPFVEGTWTFRSADDAAEERTAADDCTSLVIELTSSASVFLCGPEPSFRSIVGRPRSRFIGVRLRPGVIADLFGVPGSEITGQMLSFADLVAPKEYRAIADRLSGDLEQAFDVIFAFLGEKARSTRRLRLDRVRRAVELLSRSEPAAIGELVRELHTSERTLRRDFSVMIGLGPKRLMRVRRFRQTARRLTRSACLSVLALDAGFSDQAHMTREFVAFAGLTPSAFQRAVLPFMPGTLDRSFPRVRAS